MKPTGRVKSMGYGGGRPGFKSWLCYWLVLESWASYQVIWSLDFLTCNMVVTSTSESLCKLKNIMSAAKSLQSCPTLCDPIDGSPPGSPIPGILQVRILEWVAISFSSAWKWKVKVKSLIHVQLSNPMDCSLQGYSVHGIFQARVLEWGAIAFSEDNVYRVLISTLSCSSVQFNRSVVSDSATPWTSARQASLSITNSWSPPKPMPIKSVMPSNHYILCRPLLLMPSIFPSITVFSNESALRIRWPKCWSFSFNISSSNEHPGLISFRMDWLDLFAIQGTLKSLLQHHSSKASILRHSAFFIVQLSSIHGHWKNP